MTALSLAQSLFQKLSPRRRANLALRTYAFFKIPLLAAVAPVVQELSDSRCVVRVKLRRRTKNHLGSLYLGAQAIGAEIVAGIIALDEAQRQGRMLKFLYKDFKAEFLKRPDHDVYFVCDDGVAIRAAVARALATGERQNLAARVVARIGGPDSGEPVSRFELTLTMKR